MKVGRVQLLQRNVWALVQTHRSGGIMGLFSGPLCALNAEKLEAHFTNAAPLALFSSEQLGLKLEQKAGNLHHVQFEREFTQILRRLNEYDLFL